MIEAMLHAGLCLGVAWIIGLDCLLVGQRIDAGVERGPLEGADVSTEL